MRPLFSSSPKKAYIVVVLGALLLLILGTALYAKIFHRTTSAVPAPTVALPAAPTSDPASTPSTSSPASIASRQPRPTLTSALGSAPTLHFPLLVSVSLGLLLTFSVASSALMVLLLSRVRNIRGYIRKVAQEHAEGLQTNAQLLQAAIRSAEDNRPMLHRMDTSLKDIDSSLQQLNKSTGRSLDSKIDKIDDKASTIHAKTGEVLSALREINSPVGVTIAGKGKEQPAPAAPVPGSELRQVVGVLTQLVGRISDDWAEKLRRLESATVSLQREVGGKPSALSLGPALTPSPAPAPSFSLKLSNLLQGCGADDPLTGTGKRLLSVMDRMRTERTEDQFLNALAESVFEPLLVPLASADLSAPQAALRVQMVGALEQNRQRAAVHARDDLGLEIIPIVPKQTRFDPGLHDKGAESPTDLEQLNGRIATVYRSGFINCKDTDRAVIRKAEVGVYRYEKPAAPVSTQALLLPTVVPPSQIDEAVQSIAEVPPGEVTDAAVPSAMIAGVETEVEQRLRSMAPAWEGMSITKRLQFADDLTRAYDGLARSQSRLEEFASEISGGKVRLNIPSIGATYDPNWEIEGPRTGSVVRVLRVGLTSDAWEVKPTVLMTLDTASEMPQGDGRST